MKTNLNDPRITAFALGELKGPDAVEMARAVQSDPRVRAAVDEVRETASLLMETLGGESHMLTPAQRDTVRKAGSGPVISDISSARVPFWKRPAVAGIGVAAAVALSVYYIGGRPGSAPAGGGGSDRVEPFDWAQADMQSLTLPAEIATGPGGGTVSSADQARVHSVSTAISDDTHRFRRELRERIGKMEAGEISTARDLPELDGTSSQPWQSAEASKLLRVPLASGATSWPWIKRSVLEQKKLPPSRAVRIEEMVNHFRYQAPGMIRGAGVVADMELCDTPWNPLTVLLAVHVRADPNQPESAQTGAPVFLEFKPERVSRFRLLGYCGVRNSEKPGNAGPSKLSKSQGNYVIYEIETKTAGAQEMGEVIAELRLGSGESEARYPVGRANSWIHGSADLRFASVVAACGILLHHPEGVAELDAQRLVSLVDVLEKQDSSSLGGDRREALELFRQIAGLVTASTGN